MPICCLPQNSNTHRTPVGTAQHQDLATDAPSLCVQRATLRADGQRCAQAHPVMRGCACTHMPCSPTHAMCAVTPSLTLLCAPGWRVGDRTACTQYEGTCSGGYLLDKSARRYENHCASCKKGYRKSGFVPTCNARMRARHEFAHTSTALCTAFHECTGMRASCVSAMQVLLPAAATQQACLRPAQDGPRRH